MTKEQADEILARWGVSTEQEWGRQLTRCVEAIRISRQQGAADEDVWRQGYLDLRRAGEQIGWVRP